MSSPPENENDKALDSSAGRVAARKSLCASATAKTCPALHDFALRQMTLALPTVSKEERTRPDIGVVNVPSASQRKSLEIETS